MLMIKLYTVFLALLSIAVFSASSPSLSAAMDEESVIINFDVLENFRQPAAPPPLVSATPVEVITLPLTPPLPARKPLYTPPVKKAPVHEPEISRPSPSAQPKEPSALPAPAPAPAAPPPVPQPKAEASQPVPEDITARPMPSTTEAPQAPATPLNLDTATITYHAGEIAPPRGAQDVITAQILPQLQNDPGLRMSITSYASPDGEGQSSARRISLARGIMLRKKLIELGVAPNRIDIKPRGAEEQENPVDKIELEFIR